MDNYDDHMASENLSTARYSNDKSGYRENLNGKCHRQRQSMAMQLPGAFPHPPLMLPGTSGVAEDGSSTAAERSPSRQSRDKATKSHASYTFRKEESMSYSDGTDDDIPDVYIAIMGVTGSGKSKFIQLCTQSQLVEVGHGLRSCTQDVGEHVFTFNGKRIHLIDTPGFDDTSRSDREVLDEIVTWFGIAYKIHIRLTGIVYIHRITEPRMAGTALSNLRMFKKLCGEDYYPRVSLTTTFWDTVPERNGAFRETELVSTDEFWGQMVKQGSRIYRHHGDRKSAMHILESIMQRRNDARASMAPTYVEVQREMAEEHKTLDETSAGQEVNSKILAERRRFEKRLAEAKAEWKKALEEKDRESAESLRKYQADIKKKLEQGYDDQKKLNVRLEEMESQHVGELEKLQQAIDSQQNLINNLKAQNRVDEEELRHLPPQSNAAVALRYKIEQTEHDIDETTERIEQQQKTLARKRDLIMKAVRWARAHPDTITKIGMIGLKVAGIAFTAYHASKRTSQLPMAQSEWASSHVEEVDEEYEGIASLWQPTH